MASQSRASSARESRRVSQFAKFRAVELSLIPLVDVFISLVFFMLLTQTQSVTPVAPGVRLPEARTGAEAPERITIGIGSQPAQITIDGQVLMTVQQAAAVRSEDPSQPLLIPQLLGTLRQKADSVRRVGNIGRDRSVDVQVAIHGDRTMRYDLLARIMQSARHAGFRNITLQVLRSEEGGAVAQGAN